MNKLKRQLKDSKIDNHKINISDYFELAYLRHRYFRKSQNPSTERIQQFEEMVCNVSDYFFSKNFRDFKMVGFEKEDIRNISRVHVISFISISGLKENKDLMNKFIKRHKSIYGEDSLPGDKDIFLKECYDLYIFLKQRMSELSRIVKSKNNNIRGTSDTHHFFLGDSHIIPENDELVHNPEKYGFQRITKKYFNTLKEECKNDKNLQVSNSAKKFLTKEGKVAIMIVEKSKELTHEDIQGTDMDPRRGYFYRTPEENIIFEEIVYNLKE